MGDLWQKKDALDIIGYLQKGKNQTMFGLIGHCFLYEAKINGIGHKKA